MAARGPNARVPPGYATQDAERMRPTPTITATREAELYLQALTRHAPSYALLDVRYRVAGPQFARLFLAATRSGHAAQILLRIGRRTDVYVGIAPRLRRRGTRQDLAPTALLWADCDTHESIERLRAFPVEPSMIVASGTNDNAHAYWLLTEPLPVPELEHANRVLADTLAADVKCADATRILRVPGSHSFKHRPPRPVHLTHWTPKRYEPSEILNALPAPPTAARAKARTPTVSDDPLLRIPPPRYVEVLLGVQIPSSRKIHCPFHPDTTPSFHIYPSPDQGWACFGCSGSDGRSLGGDIYTLASRLWFIPARGRGFHKLRARLDALFEIERG